MSPLLGCIADDYTGATDLASFLVSSGMKTLQVNGLTSLASLHNSQITDPYDAIIVALKIRSVPAHQAVKESLEALQWLNSIGAQKFYYKYCSTFDSTPQGNIGPVLDAMMDALNVRSTIICPALPVNGRTVYQGYLFVHENLLNESPMKNHPLNPMLDASLPRLIEGQARGKAASIPYDIVEQGKKAIQEAFTAAASQAAYLVVDALNDQHLVDIAHASEAFTLVSGGSGLAIDLCAEFERKGIFKRRSKDEFIGGLPGNSIILSGSCSAMTQAQVKRYADKGPSLFLDPLKLATGETNLEATIAWLENAINADHELPPLIYATSTPERVEKIQSALGVTEAQALIEGAFAAIARACVKMGIRNYIVAGGETSGAVVNALQVNLLEIGASIAPGVPLVRAIGPTQTIPINLALKSGNFGDEDFFETAIKVMQC